MPIATGAKYWILNHPIATHGIAPPVQNVWYTILDTTEDVNLQYMAAIHSNVGAVAKTIEFRLTIDGLVMTGSFLAPNSTYIYARIWSQADNLLVAAVENPAGLEGKLQGQSVKVEYRMTDAPGVNQTLDGFVRYGTLEPT